MLYLIVKFVHVLLAIVAVGTNATYGVWLARLRANPESAESILRGIKVLDDRLANPAYGLLLVTGLLEAYLGGYSLGTKWIDIALILYVLLVVIAVVFYTPTLKKQIAAVANGGIDSPEAMKFASRGQAVGMLLGLIAVVIVFLMVVKPT
ncbi:MAG TPA: DUF2269 family protein [Candidatus Acidoferrales bacterium]|nr:DUF2269 family protein [Candidatus Acidoferrales bacterium]